MKFKPDTELALALKPLIEKSLIKSGFIPGSSNVPVSGKSFDDQELLYMIQAVLDGWWTEGRFAKELELELCKYLGISFCSLVNSGSSANLLAFTALTSPILGKRRIKAGDEVITVAAGFPTTVNPIIQNNCVPVFVDINKKTLSADFNQIKAAISSKTRAVMLAHTLGNPCHTGELAAFCKKHNLWFIEDNCDGLGSKYKGKFTGTFGDISTLSFYPAHHITTGEGGAVFTDNALLNKIIRSLRDWGRDCWCDTGKDATCGMRFNWKLGNLPVGYDHKYTYSHLGYNLKMTDIQAACGLAQLAKLDSFVKARKHNYALLKKKLSKFEKYFQFVEPVVGGDPSWFGFLISLKPVCKFSREEFMQYLNSKKIGTRLLFAGNITKQPYFVSYKFNYRQVSNLADTDWAMTNTFWIGLSPNVTDKMIDFVGVAFEEFLSKPKL